MRPRRVGEILDAAIKLYAGNARVLMGAVAVVVVPLQLIYGIVLLSAYGNAHEVATVFSGVGSAPPTPAEARARLGAQAIGFVITLVANSLILAACVKALSDSYLGQRPGARDSLRFGLRRVPVLMVQMILRYILYALFFVALIIPGIWLYGALAVSVPALVIERAGPVASLNRSRRLVRGSWWRTAAVILVAMVIMGFGQALISGILIGAALASSSPSLLFAVAIMVLAAIVSSILLQPFVAAVATVLYYDLRIRREGYDLELIAEELGIPAINMPPSPWGGGFTGPVGPEDVGRPGGPPYWPPPPGWRPGA